MTFKKGFKKVISFALAGAMALGLAVTGGGGNALQVEAAESLAYDSASQVNFSTVLGRAVDFGIVAGTINKDSHMETTYATKLFNGKENDDVDLAGSEPVHFIIADITEGSEVIFGKTYNNTTDSMQFNIETTEKVKSAVSQNSDFNGTLSYKISDKSDIEANIDSIIDHISDESSDLAKKDTSVDLTKVKAPNENQHSYVLDLRAKEFKDSVVYINVEDDSVLQQKISETGQLLIKKDSSTVVVFNVPGDDVKIAKYFVDAGNGEVETSCTVQGDDSAHNREVDNEIAQKVIWNIYEASKVELNIAAGTFIVPNEEAVITCLGQNNGWLATAGTVNVNSEWHYIYHGRSNDVSTDEEGQFHFAARKAFTDSFIDRDASGKIKEDETVHLTNKEYSFKLYQTGSDYNIDNGTLKGTVQNDEYSKIVFPTIEVSNDDFGGANAYDDAEIGGKSIDLYYVIKEDNGGTVHNGIQNSSGEIDIYVKANQSEEGKITFTISSWKYLTAEDKNEGSDKAYRPNTNVSLIGPEFTLGGIYNLVTYEKGRLKVKKTFENEEHNPITLNDNQKSKVSFNIVGSNYGCTRTVDYSDFDADGTYTFEGLPIDDYTVTETLPNGDFIADYKFKSSSLSDNNTTTATTSDEPDTFNIVNTYQYEKSTTGSLELTKTVTNYRDSNKVYRVALKFEDDTYVHQLDDGSIEYVSEESGVPYFELKDNDTISISGLTPGEYSVIEDAESAKVDYYSLSVGGDDSVEIIAGETAEAEVKNAYTNLKGQLTINKQIDTKDFDLMASLADWQLKKFIEKISFNVVGISESNSTVSLEIPSDKLNDFDRDTLTFSYTVTDLPAGEYRVTENVGEDSIDLDFDPETGSWAATKVYIDSTTVDKTLNGIVTPSDTPEFNVVNTYTKTEPSQDTGSLKVTKILGTGAPEAASTKTYSFTVTGPNNYSETVTVTGAGTSEPLTGLVPGEYTVTENKTGAAIDGYTLVVTGDEGSENKVTVSAKTEAEAKITNTYTQDTGSLKVTKILGAGAPEAASTKTYSFTVTGPNNYSETVTVTGAGTSEPLTGLVPGEYTVTENKTGAAIDGYTLVVTGDEGSENKVTVSAKTEAEAKITNTYTQDTGSLKVTKILGAGVPEAASTKTYSFTVTGPNNYSETVTVTGAGTSEPLTGLVPGEYTVTENKTGAAIDGYTLVVTGDEGSENKVTVSAKTEAEAKITNTYTQKKANIKLKKVITGDDGCTTGTSFTFYVKGANGKYYGADGTEYNEDQKASAAITVDSTTSDTNLVTLENLPLQAYTVSEDLDDASAKAADDYTFDNESSTKSTTVDIDEDGETVTAQLKNAYIKTGTETGSITINKKVTGDRSWDDIKSNIVFVLEKDGVAVAGIRGSDDGWTTTGSGTDVTYTFTSEDLAQGSYDVVEYIENDSSADDYILDITSGTASTSTNKSDKVSVTLSPTSLERNVYFTNNYTEKPGKLKITKTLAGDATSIDDLPDAIVFRVTPGLTAGQQYTDITLSKDNHADWLVSGSTYTYESGELTAGTVYTVTETATGANATTYTCETLPANGTIDGLDITPGDTATAEFTNTYTAVSTKGKITITKNVTVSTDGGAASSTTTDVADGTYSFTVTNKDDSTISKTATITITNGQASSTTVEDLPAGTYIVSEDTSGFTSDLTLTSGNDVEVDVDAGQTSRTSFTNNKKVDTQTPTAQFQITKTISGPVNDEDLEGLTFEVYKGDTLVRSLLLGNTNDFTYNDVTGRYESVVFDVEADDSAATDYKVVETLYNLENKTVTVSNTYSVNGTSTDGSGDTVNISVNSGDSVVASFANAYDDRKKEFSLTKYDLPGTKYIDGAILAIYSIVDEKGEQIPTSQGGVYQEWESSTTNVYTFDLSAGNYAIKEIKAPDGYQGTDLIYMFKLSFDVNGNAKITPLKNEQIGTYDSTDNAIRFYNDPIVVTGKLSVHVEEEKTGRPVPDAIVEVEGPDGKKVRYTTNKDGEITDKVDGTGVTPFDVPVGKYKVTILQVPEGFDVTVGETAEVTVPENGEGRHIAKILPNTGGLKVQVLEEGTRREVPDATVEIEAPAGTTFPDGSTKITAITDKNGWITSYKDADGNVIDLTTGLTPGDYKITVVKVPEGYKVTTGKTETVTVVKGEVATHEALIATGASAATPTKTTTPATTTTAAKSVDTGDHMNVIPFIILMIVSLISSIVVIIRKRRLRYEY